MAPSTFSLPSSAETSPVRDWDESMAATSAHGTAMACSYHCDVNNKDSGLVLLVRTPKTNIWKPNVIDSTETLYHHHPRKSNDNEVDKDGGDVDNNNNNENDIDILMHPIVSTIQFAPSWTPLGNPRHNQCNILCAMTGFSSDVEQFLRILQNELDAHETIFDNDNGGMDIFSVVSQCTNLLQPTAQRQSGRPFAISVLLAGFDTRSNNGNNENNAPDNNNNGNSIVLYTIDPSGNWQSWGRGVSVIGKFSLPFRANLLPKSKDKLKEQEETETEQEQTPSSLLLLSQPKSIKEALNLLLSTWVKTCEQVNVPIPTDDAEEFEAIVLYKNEHNKPCVAMIQNKVVHKLLQQIIIANEAPTNKKEEE